MDDRSPWELERPDVLLAALRQQMPPDEPATYLVRVDRQDDVQSLAGWTLLWREPPLDDYPDRTRLTEQALDRLGTPGFEVPYRERPLVVPVVVRPGWHAWSFDELEVFLGLRYASNSCAFMQEAPLVLTESGWCLHFSGLAGREPRARWSPQSVETMTRGAPAST